MKVLHVLDSFSFGGAENLLVELARHAPAQFDLQVASLAPRSQGRNALLGRFTELGLEPTFFRVNRMLDPAGVWDLARQLRKLEVDVVHAHLEYAATLVPLAARAAGIPCVATLHHDAGDLSWTWALRERLAIRIPGRLGRLVFVSNAAYRSFERRYGGNTAGWRMIHNGVDLDRYSPSSQAPRPLGLPADVPVWVKVAALREPKGHLDAIAAWQLVLTDNPTARLVFAGDGPARPRIEQEILARGLTDRVLLAGRVEDVPALLAGADGALSASHTEALPTALIEASACALPVVATDAGGTTDVVLEGRTGVLVPPHQPTALAAAVTEVLAAPQQAAEFGHHGRDHVMRTFSMPVWLANLRRLYDEVALTPTRSVRPSDCLEPR